MNRFNYPLMLLVFLSSLFFSCEPFDNQLPTPREELESKMPYIQYKTAYWRGTDQGRFQLQWTQQLAGVQGSYLSIDRYDMEPYHCDGIWYFYYQHILYDLEEIINLASQENSRSFRGIARILKAYSLGFMTDTWGDVPYTQAMGYFTAAAMPEYDSQQNLYMEILNLLELGIQDLNSTAEDSFRPGAAEDPIYEGNLEKWKKAANVIRLRHLLRMGNFNKDYSLVLSNITGRTMFDGTHEDMIYDYSDHLDQVNPHYYFREATRAGEFFVNMLLENDDPRLEVFLQTNSSGEYAGAAPGSGMFNSSTPQTALAGRTSPSPLITYTEQKFIEAEVYFRMNMQQQADQAFEQAVISSLRSYQIEDPQWEAQHASVENVDLEQIINAKYIALFLNPEVWNDYRRTGFPDLPPYEGSGQTQIPRRFIYPAEEFNLNGANVPQNVDMYTRMWWDIE